MTGAPMPPPIAVWDSTERGNCYFQHIFEISDWMNEHLQHLQIAAYRVEFYLIDTLFATVYGWKRNENGHLYIDPAAAATKHASAATSSRQEGKGNRDGPA